VHVHDVARAEFARSVAATVHAAIAERPVKCKEPESQRGTSCELVRPAMCGDLSRPLAQLLFPEPQT